MAPTSDGAALEFQLRLGTADLALFAAASCDRNPLHLDEQFARQTPFGRRIAHGSLVTLALLGSLPSDVLADVRSLRAWFTAPVLPEAEMAGHAEPLPDRRGWDIRLVGRGKALVRVVAYSDAEPVRVAPAPSDEPVDMRTIPDDGLPAVGLERTVAYAPGPELAEVVRRWHADSLDPALLEALVWASYVVGMEVPGRHGLFAGISMSTNADGASASPHWLRVQASDERTGHLMIDTALTVMGRRVDARLECFSRVPVPAPVQASLGQAEQQVDGSVIVVGGSRGFGASLSLALLARGYAVHVVYSSSSDAAAELQRLAGPRAERLFLHRVDARDPASFRPLLDAVSNDGLRGLVLNAALVPLGMGLADGSGVELSDYVGESVRLAAVPLGVLLSTLDRDAGWVVFCSSSAVSAPPRDWPHYVAAKGALEGLAAWLGATEPGLRTVVFRPPKMLTDLTNSPSGRIAAVSTDLVAAWLVARLAGGGIAAGLTTLEPTAEEVSS